VGVGGCCVTTGAGTVGMPSDGPAVAVPVAWGAAVTVGIVVRTALAAGLAVPASSSSPPQPASIAATAIAAMLSLNHRPMTGLPSHCESATIMHEGPPEATAGALILSLSKDEQANGSTGSPPAAPSALILG